MADAGYQLPPLPPRLTTDLTPQGAQMSPYDPDTRERLAQAVAGDAGSPWRNKMASALFGTTGLPSTDATNYGAADLLPFAGSALTGVEAVEKKDPVLAALATVPFSKVGKGILAPLGEAAYDYMAKRAAPAALTKAAKHYAEESPLQLATFYEAQH